MLRPRLLASSEMSEEERDTWDQRYADGSYFARTWPSPFLETLLPRLPSSGRALDVACGTGRNAFLLAEAGFDVEAVDVSSVALERGAAEAVSRGLDIEWRQADLDEIEFAPGRYDLIAVIRYRNESLWPKLVDALAADGWIVAEHHVKSHAPVEGPENPDFRLDPQELLRAFGALRVVHYEEILETDLDTHPYALERIAACKGDPGF